ncbi:HD family phosphohydrolase [Bacillus sp. J14TS2]|nr:HD family phosphohydrolase [Bacillus sp. J14TS2]
MNVMVEELREGYIVQKDVYGRSNYPLIPANTELTKKHIEVLKAFSIEQIEVQYQPGSKSEKEINKDAEYNVKNMDSPVHFTREYEGAVQQFRKEFQLWQTGLPINISNVRALLIPLLTIALEDKKWIYSIHHLSQAEEYMYHHPIAVSILSGWIAKRMGYSQGQIFQVALAGLLADCGMAKIDTNLFMNTRTLNDSEWRKIKEHPLYSYQMVKNISILKPETKLAIVQHHERLDGTGYPSGKKGNSVSMMSQIIAIADIYHAMTSKRLFKNQESPFKTLELMKIDQFGKLHIIILKELISTIANLPIGTTIRLSNGQQAEVVFAKTDAKLRPLVSIGETGEIIDLERNRNLYIECIVKDN